MLEKRILQAVIFVAAWVPIVAGMAGVVDGTGMIHGAVSANPDLESHFRYLSGLLLGIGIAFMLTIPSVERRSDLFLALGGIVVTGGLSRLLFALLHGSPTAPHRFALVMELLVVPALMIWQRRIASTARSTS